MTIAKPKPAVVSTRIFLADVLGSKCVIDRTYINRDKPQPDPVLDFKSAKKYHYQIRVADSGVKGISYAPFETNLSKIDAVSFHETKVHSEQGVVKGLTITLLVSDRGSRSSLSFFFEGADQSQIQIIKVPL